MRAAINQPFRFQEKLEAAGVRHGDTVRADVRGIRVTGAAATFGKPTVAFCFIGPVVVKEPIARGDGGRVPSMVKIRGRSPFPSDGVYDVEDAIVATNGRIVLSVDNRTRVNRLETAGV